MSPDMALPGGLGRRRTILQRKALPSGKMLRGVWDGCGGRRQASSSVSLPHICRSERTVPRLGSSQTFPRHPTAFRKGWPPSTAVWVRVCACVSRMFSHAWSRDDLFIQPPPRLEGMASGLQPITGPSSRSLHVCSTHMDLSR